MIKYNALRFFTVATIILNINLYVNGAENFGIEAGLRVIYNNYKQCQTESEEMTICLKLKALKLADRALTINSIPIIDGVLLTKGEESSRALNAVSDTTTLDENKLAQDPMERNKHLDRMIWERIKSFMETRSLQLKVNQLFGTDNTETNIADGRGKKDKKGGMYMYMMMMKGGMLALAYKGLALLAGKALLVSKIALTLALLIAAKKLFSHGHSQKTTYEIVKTPVVTHSHQYSGNNAAPQHGQYGAGDFSSYDGGPYARSFDLTDQKNSNRNVNYRIEPPVPKYVTHIIETYEGRSLSGKEPQARSLSNYNQLREQTTYEKTVDNAHENDDQSTRQNALLNADFQRKLNVPYAHLVAYRSQLKPINGKNAGSQLKPMSNTDNIIVVSPSTSTNSETAPKNE